MGDDEPMTDPNAKAVTVAGPSDAGDGAVDLSVHPSGIVPQLQCVRAPQFEGHLPSFFFSPGSRAPSRSRLGAPAKHRADPRFPYRRNIVATVNLDCKLDLKTIAFHARNVEYNPKVRKP